MEQSLKGKNAVVTGSTSGIGEATAIALADAGANVVINGFGDAEAIEQLRQDLARRSGGKALYLGADMSKTEEIEGFFAKVVAELGSVDILVNNAGIQYTARVADFPAERWDAIIAINLSAVFHCTRLVLTGMSEKGWGRGQARGDGADQSDGAGDRQAGHYLQRHLSGLRVDAAGAETSR